MGNFFNNMRVHLCSDAIGKVCSASFVKISKACIAASLIIYPFSQLTAFQLDPEDQEKCEQFINIKKEIEKLLKPIKKLNKFSSPHAIAKEAAKFKIKIESYYPLNKSTDKIFDRVIQEFNIAGLKANKKRLKKLIDLIKHYETKLKQGQDIDGLFPEDAIDDYFFEMPPEAAIGCVEVFCGVIICFLPFPMMAALGGGVILNGINRVIDANVKELK